MARLDKNSLVIAYIKELLKDFNLPIVSVLTDDTVPYKGRMYIKDHKIGYFGEKQFEPLYDFIRNYKMVNLTKNFIINSSDYDEYTHNYLGEYLRFLRDFDGLNLMGLYNCFYKQQPRRLNKRVNITNDYKFIIDTDNTNYNFYLVPVKFNKQYTISVSAGTSYELALVIHNNQFLSESGDRLIKASYFRVHNTSAKDPFLYSTYISDDHGDVGEELWPKEKYLRLLIKIPASVKSSIVILEGNWLNLATDVGTMTSLTYIIGDKSTYYDDLGNKLPISIKYPDMFLYNSSLIKTNNNAQIPFANRLVEYLLHNTIDSNEFIDSNIKRLQDQMYLYTPDLYGIWNDELRVKLYDRIFEEDLMLGKNINAGTSVYSVESGESISNFRRLVDTRPDLLGFVDKDLERQIELIREKEI